MSSGEGSRTSVAMASPWIRRIAIGVVTALIAVVALFNASANAVWLSQPAVAAKLFPIHGGAVGRASLPNDSEMAVLPRVKELAAIARRAITLQAITPAFATIGVEEELQGNQAGAVRAFTMADRISRRDLLPQLWLIEYYSAHDNLPTTLRHYDTALRVTRRVDELLFPVLSAGLDDPEISKNFRPYLNVSNPWLESFLTYAIRTGANRASLARMLIANGGMPKAPEYSRLEGELVSYLITAGDYVTARDFFLSASRLPATIFKRVDFSTDTIVPRFAPLTWFVRASPDMSGDFVTDNAEEPYFHISAGSATQQEILSKYLFLTPGKYQMQFWLTSDTPALSGEWTTLCMDAQRTKATKSFHIDSQRRINLFEFNVAPACSVQKIAFTASAMAVAGESELSLGGLAIRSVH